MTEEKKYIPSIPSQCNWDKLYEELRERSTDVVINAVAPTMPPLFNVNDIFIDIKPEALDNVKYTTIHKGKRRGEFPLNNLCAEIIQPEAVDVELEELRDKLALLKRDHMSMLKTGRQGYFLRSFAASRLPWTDDGIMVLCASLLPSGNVKFEVRPLKDVIEETGSEENDG